MKKKCTIGIDLGGTKIYFAIISEKGEIIHEFKDKTGATGGSDLISQLIKGTDELLKYADQNDIEIKAIGIGSPGRIDSKNGIVVDTSPNIKNWKGINIKKSFAEKFDIPAFIDNDANIAAYGEYALRKSKNKNESTIVVLTLGTGLGGGIIYNDNLFRGKGLAPEIGHMIIHANGRQCNCGQIGCFEMYVSGTALENQAKERLDKYPNSELNKVEDITSYDIFKQAKSKDLFAQILIDEMAEYLAHGIVSLVNLFDPDLILLAGGLSQENEMYIDKVLNVVEKTINYSNFDRKIVQIAESNDKAGLIGAGLIAFHGYEKGDI